MIEYPVGASRKFSPPVQFTDDQGLPVDLTELATLGTIYWAGQSGERQSWAADTLIGPDDDWVEGGFYPFPNADDDTPSGLARLALPDECFSKRDQIRLWVERSGFRLIAFDIHIKSPSTLSSGSSGTGAAVSSTTSQQPNPDHFGGARVRAKRPTIALRAGYKADLSHQLLVGGVPVDLTAYGLEDGESESDESVSVRVRLFEIAGGSCATDLDVTVTEAEAGLIEFTVPEGIAGSPGLWLMEFSVVDANNAAIFLGDAYLYIERTAGAALNGPPALPEIRLYLRDFAQENELLDAIDFDASEIAFAAQMCIDEWNSADPIDGPSYSANNFPFRREWLLGISGYLFGIAAEHYARNQLPYNAAGLSHDDKGKWQMYHAKAAAARAEWRQFMTSRRYALAGQAGFQEIGGFF